MTQRRLQAAKPSSPLKPDAPQIEIDSKLIKKIEDELNLKEKLVKNETIITGASVPSTIPTLLEFYPPLSIEVPYSEESLIIDTIEVGNVITETEEDLPFLGIDLYEGRAADLKLFLYRIPFEGTFHSSPHGLKKINSFCASLQAIKLTFNPLYCRIFGGLVINKDETHLWLVTDSWKGTKMSRLLETCGRMSFASAARWTRQLLQATVAMHSCNVAHQDINVQNIIIGPGQKLCLLNYSVSRFLRETHQINPISSNFAMEREWYWRPPELMSRRSALGKKADIWAIGYILLQMLFGSSFLKRFKDSQEGLRYLRENMVLPNQLLQIIELLLAPQPHDRPDAVELLNHVAFSPTTMESFDDFTFSSQIRNKASPLMSLRESRSDESIPKGTIGRYQTDFEEIQFLGKGAFGEVIKVCNRIDGRFYAIKRIRLDPNDAENNKKILREVTLLSRLHHERIVRYYQAWIEGSIITRPLMEASSAVTSLAITKSPESSEEEENYVESDASDFDATLGISGRKLFPSKLVESTVGLSSLVQLHTGFTSSEGEMGGNLIIQKPTKEIEQQILYIQMEYCPNQTLRDIIDSGVEQGEAWRLFRQIVEGLVYLHAQGLIHRDLKPGNIFIDTNGDIKIGDFGLAVGHEHVHQQIKTKSLIEPFGASPRNSLTGGIGTPLYVSPEQENQKIGQGYDQKVDMYSLGIILLELLVPFQTTMERMIVIDEARSTAIKLPLSISGNAEKILRNLLDHNPLERFSAEDLLKTGLLPAKLEAEYVVEAIRAVANPSGAYYDKLVRTLFSFSPEELTANFTFDYNSETTINAEGINRFDEVIKSIWKHCRIHGGVFFPAPLLLPYVNCFTLPLVRYLGIDGHLACLPSEPTTPWARFAAQNSLNEIRRFFIGPIFEENSAGGQPKHRLVASFEMISLIDDRLPNFLENVQVAYEALKENVLGGNLLIKIGHIKLLEAILTHCLIPSNRINSILEYLARFPTSSWPKIKNDLTLQFGLSEANISSLGQVVSMKEMETKVTLKKLEELLKSVKDLSGHFQFLYSVINALNHIELECEILFDPLFVLNPKVWCGTTFGICLEERKRAIILAYGGEFTELMTLHKLPFDRACAPIACGAIWNVAKLLTLQEKSTTLHTLQQGNVLVYSSGTEMLNEKLQVASMLWKAGIKAIIIPEDHISSEYLNQVTRTRNISILVFLKDTISRGRFSIVKVKNLEKRNEEEINRTDLARTILSYEEHGTSKGPLEPHPLVAPINVSLFSPFGKIKGAQRTTIMDKTVKSLAPLLASLTGSKPVEVIAHDISRPLVHLVIAKLEDSDDIIKKTIEDKEEREIASKLRSLLRTLKDTNQLALLYNYRERFIDLAVTGSVATLSRLE